ncbi:hypothetical protein GCM10009760_26880 [Kitasatospora kazusensis]|uniref:DUF2798 domain-containing protein n=1 Tax=Kitasatospora kazusensis TaxID=407974 RepID=A0ABN2ZGX9_9ACTN
MKPQPGYSVDLLIATAVTLAVSVGAGLLATLPLDDGASFSTRAAVFMFTSCPLIMVCISASEPFMRRAALRRIRNTRRQGRPTHRTRRPESVK